MHSKCKECFFIKVMTSKTNYSLLFMLIKCGFKKRHFFLKQPWVFSRALHFETHKSRRSSHSVLSSILISSTQEQIISFPRKITRELHDFKTQIVLNSHRNNFGFQNARSRFQDSFLTNIPLPNWKWEKWDNGHSKPLFVWVADRAHLKAMTNTRG